MTAYDVLDAKFDYEQAHGVRVTEIHVSPRVQLETIRAMALIDDTFDPPVRGTIGAAYRVGGASWFLDLDLAGTPYRFVTAPAADASVQAS